MRRAVLLVALLLALPAAVQAQLMVFGGQQTWSYAGGDSYTGMGGGIGLRTGILPIFDIAVDASYYLFEDDGGTKPSSLNYSASAILGKKKDRVNLYAGIGQYDLRFDNVSASSSVGVHGGLSIHLLGPISADARVILLQANDGTYDDKVSTRIFPISIKFQF